MYLSLKIHLSSLSLSLPSMSVTFAATKQPLSSEKAYLATVPLAWPPYHCHNHSPRHSIPCTSHPTYNKEKHQPVATPQIFPYLPLPLLIKRLWLEKPFPFSTSLERQKSLKSSSLPSPLTFNYRNTTLHFVSSTTQKNKKIPQKLPN